MFAAYLRNYDESKGEFDPRHCRRVVSVRRSREAAFAEARRAAGRLAREVWAPGGAKTVEPLIEVEAVTEEWGRELAFGLVEGTEGMQ